MTNNNPQVIAHHYNCNLCVITGQSMLVLLTKQVDLLTKQVDLLTKQVDLSTKQVDRSTQLAEV